MSSVPETKETRSPSASSDSSLNSKENEQVSDNEELQKLLEQRSSSPDIKSSEEKLLSEFRSLHSETLSISILEQSISQEDDKKVSCYNLRYTVHVLALAQINHYILTFC